VEVIENLMKTQMDDMTALFKSQNFSSCDGNPLFLNDSLQSILSSHLLTQTSSLIEQMNLTSLDNKQDINNVFGMNEAVSCYFSTTSIATR